VPLQGAVETLQLHQNAGASSLAPAVYPEQLHVLLHPELLQARQAASQVDAHRDLSVVHHDRAWLKQQFPILDQ
jgi:hypothetical protein